MSSFVPAADHPSLAPGLRRRGLIVAISCLAVMALAIGAMLPLLSITMERMGVPGWLIGTISAMPFITGIAVWPFLPALLRRVPAPPLLAACALTTAFCVIAHWIWFDIGVWFVLRAVSGVAMAVVFTTGEAWVNQFASDRRRGRIVALYIVSANVGLACGSLLISLTGTTGLLPFAVIALIFTAGALPLAGGGRLPGLFDHPLDRSLAAFLFAAPLITLAALIYGAMETLLFNLFSVYGLRTGLEDEAAAALIAAFSAGVILCQLPVGWLADHMNRIALLIACACLAGLSVALMPLIAGSPVLLFAATFSFGATAAGIYTLAMVLAAQRFQAANLAAMNTVIVLCYNIGSLVSLPAGGWAIDFWNPHGLPAFVALLAALLAAAALAFLARRRG